MALLAAVRKEMPEVELQQAPVGSHQSIGAAEQKHDHIASQVRVMVAVIQEKAKLVVKPHTYIFPWMVRHAAFIINRYKKRRDGTTPYHACTGKAKCTRACTMGEKINYKINDPSAQGKSVPRWNYGIWVGINDVDKAHVILTPAGAVMARVVKRVVEEQMWDAELLQQVRGLPWSKTAGAGTGAQLRLLSLPEATHLPTDDVTAGRGETLADTPAHADASPGVGPFFTPRAAAETPTKSSGPASSSSSSPSMSVGTATPPGRRGTSADANTAEGETNEDGQRETSAESPTRRRLLEELSPSSTSPAEPDNKRREIGAISTKKDTSWIKRNPDGSDDKHIIASMYDVAPNIAQGERHDLRMQELLKLESFGSWW